LGLQEWAGQILLAGPTSRNSGLTNRAGDTSGVRAQWRRRKLVGTTNEDLRQVVDESELLGRVGGNRSLLREVAGLFVVESPKMLSDIRAAAARADTTALVAAAHKLRGSVAIFAAPAAVGAAARVERIGRDGTAEDAGEACAQLEREIARVRRALLEMMTRD
jgi:HPt (histidine-containing phosphotransfer) domain-containing protein